ncbi:MAG: trehalose-phosphatase [Acidimicrobiales bacterium]|nr:trehalose-phosphatase [Acidimicrobiales bacterium]
MSSPTEVLAAARRQPDRTALLFDFDGSLAAFVDDPATATLTPEAAELLRRLVSRYRTVGVVSGRPVDFLARHLDPGVVLSGLYGLEQLQDGRRQDDPAADAWRAVVDRVTAVSESDGPAGMRVEGKGLSLTLHYRTRPELAGEVQAWAEAQAAASGLELRPAKMSVELHPPIAVDKGSAVAALAAGADIVVYVGDDVGDLPAFDALDAMAASGRTVLRVAVAGAGAPPALVERADVAVADPQALVELFSRL